jgi:DNA-directed RNA polymerase specialized sigma24 family protein
LVERHDLVTRIICAISPPLEAFILKQGFKPQLEDILQDCLLQITIGLDKFHGDEDEILWGWCYTIVRHKLGKYLDERKKSLVESCNQDELEKVIDTATENSHISFQDKLDAKFYISILEEADGECLELMTRRYVEDWDYKTIADIFKLSSADAARMRINRCREEARKLLKSYI